VRDIDDIVQESFLRVWRTRASRPIQYAKAFLFKVASHLAIDQSRQASTSRIDEVGDVEQLEVIQEGAGVVGSISTREKVKILAAAIDDLPTRCREVVVLRKFEGFSQRDAAARLGLAEKTVEAHLARGIAKIKEYMRVRGVDQCYNVDESF